MAKKKTDEAKGYGISCAPALLERFRAHCARKGLSLSAGIRLAMVEYMERGK